MCKNELKPPTMSLVAMAICKNGICCITDSRIIKDGKVVSDEAYKSTVIKNVNGLNLLVGVAGMSEMNGGEITPQLNRRFNNSSVNVEYYDPECGVRSTLYAISQYVQMNKKDNETTCLVFGYYLNNQPRLAVFSIDKDNINSSFIDTPYVVCGQPESAKILWDKIKDVSLSTVTMFAHDCVQYVDEIIESGKDKENFGVGGFINVIAIDERNIKNVYYD